MLSPHTIQLYDLILIHSSSQPAFALNAYSVSRKWDSENLTESELSYILVGKEG